MPPTMTPTRPIISVLRAPKMTRLRMSRPAVSVPNQCVALGGCITLARLV